MGISFLYPGMLWGLLSLAIPLLIHFLNFQRPKKVLFTRVLFVEKIKESNRKVKTLRNWLVLLARMLFLAFLVLAFAQPVFKDQAGALKKGLAHIQLYVDNSFSMQAEAESGTLLDNSLSMAERIVRGQSPNTRFQVLSNDFQGQDFYFLSREEALDRLAEITHSPRSKTWEEVQGRMEAAANKEEKGYFERYWFHDGQKSTAGNLQAWTADTASANQIFLMQAADQGNVFIDSVWLGSDFNLGAQEKEIQFRLNALGNKEGLKVPVKLFLDGVQTASAIFDLKPSESTQHNFKVSNKTDQTMKGEIRVAGPGPVFDDTVFFVLKPMPKIKVALVDGSKGGYVKKGFGNPEIFDLQYYKPQAVDYEALKKADLLVIDQVSQLGQGLSSIAQNFYQEGKSVFVIPAADQSNSSLDLVLGGLTQATTLDTNGQQPQHIAKPNANVPFFQGVFEKQNRNVKLPKAKPLLKLGNPGYKLLRFRSGGPFLSLFKNRSGGSFYLLNSPLHEAHGNFHRHAYFVVTLYRMAKASLQVETQLAYGLDQSIVQLPSSLLEAGKETSLKGQGISIYPELRATRGKWALAWESKQMRPGYYKLAQDGKTMSTLAFNADPKESRPDAYTASQLQSLLPPNFTFSSVSDEMSYAEQSAVLEGKQSLWKYFLLIACLFILAEMILLRIFKMGENRV